ncbi:PSD1 and planctomycete cytochrome C domain-containing protein [Crateriforma conspicua]|uniref:Planctomycete cytochrome C n=1 Tax=Crateriforma conspicua TaxID=2527996 RepID=A0A5C5XZC9_9PLAN|nr:PSD1 and planctomycete cytochrome C domain-containing protein [Crateriforma conspicua]TWT68254.1 Planctomycete cytochrome C [Crateriforma conspicua]
MHPAPCPTLCRVVATLVVCGFTGDASHAESPRRAPSPRPASTPQYGRDVRPILAKHCFTCHGPDDQAREAGLRLDTADGSRSDLGGYAAIAPGDPDTSELWLRITTDDPDIRMPPADGHRPLSDDEQDILRQWIADGAAYEQHWAFVPPQRRRPPPTDMNPWCSDAIDAFVLQAMKDQDLSPSQPADDVAWLRRVYLDLAGTLPTPGDVDRFVSDDSPMARQRIVDRLLASPDFAQQWARPWLDLARYSDTNGYEKDRPRTMWPYRDWVLSAINDDMPFDQFTIDQLAGDMVDSASDDQRIATGFHRNTMLNEEGGIDPLEYRWLSVVDRVATTGTVWMGLTTGCAQCHTHKYDPITHTDYYRLFAVLNNADEPDLVVTEESAEADYQRRIDRAREQMDRWSAEHLGDDGSLREAFDQFVTAQRQSLTSWTTLNPQTLDSTMPILTVQDDGSVLARGDVTKRDQYQLSFRIPESIGRATAIRIDALPHPSLPAGGPGMAYYEGRRGDFFLSELTATADGEPMELRDATQSYGELSVGSGAATGNNVIDGEGSTGWSTSGRPGEAHHLVIQFAKPLVAGQTLSIGMLFERHFAAALGHFRVSVTDRTTGASAVQLPTDLEDRLLALGDSETLPDALATDLRHWFLRTSDQCKAIRGKWSWPERDVVRGLVMAERPAAMPRLTQRHHRGEYLQPAEVVTPGNLSLFTSATSDDDGPASFDRLALARFLASEQNPLVGRVMTNRYWRQMFGAGIVRTDGDFGTQSESPSHPDLIDHLAVRWIDGGWSAKRLIRDLAFSSTYGQSIGRPPVSDPDNRLLSVFPYRRLTAETLRDSLLSASGVLTRRFGGPSVYPPQPPAVMKTAYGSPAWPTSKADDRYRRSVYTFSKRTAPFAAFLTFDGPTGEQCVPRRQSSTNPLQALTTLNDPMFVDITQRFADDVLHATPDADPSEIAIHIFRRVLVRTPTTDEVRDLVDFYTQHRSWLLVVRAVMNLDESITIP